MISWIVLNKFWNLLFGNLGDLCGEIVVVSRVGRCLLCFKWMVIICWV